MTKEERAVERAIDKEVMTEVRAMKKAYNQEYLRKTPEERRADTEAFVKEFTSKGFTIIR
jgi:hypothetical protein